MKPYDIYPKRIIAHLEIDEHMRQISYPPEEIQERTIKILINASSHRIWLAASALLFTFVVSGISFCSIPETTTSIA